MGFFVLLAAASTSLGTGAPALPPLPRPDHVVIVIEENRSFSSVIGSDAAPYINSLATRGAVFTNFFAVARPSQPNYLALFSGSTQGVTSNAAPPPGSPYGGPNLATGLFSTGRSFAGYSEDLPFAGFTGASDGNYRRRHNPWVNFSNVPASSNLPFTEFPPPGRFDALPTVSIVVPNLANDMHNGSTSAGDAWLRDHLDAYIRWAETHNSLFILTWDEGAVGGSNQIPTLLVGPMVRPGSYGEPRNHLHLLRTLEDFYGLPYAGESATVAPIVDVWQGSEPAGSTSPSKKNTGACGALGIGAVVIVALRRLGRR
jgi:hypothetical protein